MKNKQSKKKKMKIWKKILLVVLLVIIIFVAWFGYRTYKNGGGLSGMLATVVGHNEMTKKDLPELKVLLLGVSTDESDNAPADTIMIASYNPNTQQANLLSIPRDTYIGKNKKRATPSDKINCLYSLGIDKMLNAVNDLTGLDIEYYVVVKTEALIKLVDAIGGVDFYVPIDMKYTDTSQNLFIDLKEGMQKIDGNKAEQLLRFRKNDDGTSYSDEYGDNDTGRMRTQREFIQEVLKQTLKPSNIFKLGQILDIANNYVESNIELSYAKDYIPYAVEFNSENLTTGVIPGVNAQLPPATKKWWFFEPNKSEMQELIHGVFYNEEEQKENIDNETQNISNVSDTSKKTKEEIKIEVLNGTGKASALQETVNLLKKQGFKVTKTGSTSQISKTIITNKKEIDNEYMNQIKEILGNGSITNNKNLNSKVDITIIVGSDFNN